MGWAIGWRPRVACLTAGAFCAYSTNYATTMAATTFSLANDWGAFFVGLQSNVFIGFAIAIRALVARHCTAVQFRTLLVVGSLAFALPVLVTMGCTDRWQFLALRIVQSAGLAIWPSCAADCMVHLAPNGKAGRVLSVLKFGCALSVVAGPFCGAVLSSTSGLGALYVGAFLLATGSGLLALGVGNSRGSKYVKTKSAASPVGVKSVYAVSLLAGAGYSLVLVFGDIAVGAAQGELGGGFLFAFVGLGSVCATLLLSTRRNNVWSSATVLASGCLFSIGIAGLAANAGSFNEITVLSGVLAGAGYYGIMTTSVAYVGENVAGESKTKALAWQQNAIDLGIGVGGLAIGTALDSGIGYGKIALVCLIAFCGALFAALRATKVA